MLESIDKEHKKIILNLVKKTCHFFAIHILFSFLLYFETTPDFRDRIKIPQLAAKYFGGFQEF